jgi:hypothetical protein
MVAFLLACSGTLLAQSCTGLCLLQQKSCPGNATTSISGVVYAPNETDPLPHVMVYIPNAPVEPFPSVVSCPLAGAAPSGSPLVGAITAVDGSFTLTNVPVGQNIPLVIVTGRWRRQFVIPNTTACTNTKLPADFAVMPQNHLQGDIPRIAIATGQDDALECALRVMGISPSEFTDPAPNGQGRINLFGGGGAPGSGIVLDSDTPTQAALMGDPTVLNQYDVLMLPCEGGDYPKPQQELSNLIDYANAGGRVFTSHFSYSWMWNNAEFNNVAQWIGGPDTEILPEVGLGTVNTSFAEGETLAEWLPLAGATSTPGEIPVVTGFQDTNGVIAPTQEWLTATYSLHLFPGPPLIFTTTAQFVFDTPIAPTGTTVNQCGRVLYNDYHVENPPSNVTASTIFPNECPREALTGMSPQEKMLEYDLFELTDDGGLPSIIPVAYDFGSEAVDYPSASELFTWTNNSSDPMAVSSVSITGSDFSVVAGTDTCSNMIIAGGGSCTITVGFTPLAIGARTGTLSVVSGGISETASLSGTGVPGFSLSPGSLSFGSVVVGDTSSQTVTLTSNASGPQPLPVLQITTGFSVSTTGCANPVPALGTCVVTVTFSPTEPGVQSGTLTAVVPLSDQRTLLSGTGTPDFTLTPATLDFGYQDVGVISAPQYLTLQSYAIGTLATPVFATTGSYSVSTAACGAQIAAQSACLVSVTFDPQTPGPNAGTLADNSTNLVYAGLSATMTGIGVDFTISLNPTSGSVIAGDGVTTNVTVTPTPGFAAALTLSCTAVSALTASSCNFPSPTLTPTNAVTESITITTTSQYTVVGYSGFGGRGYLWLIALGSGCLLWSTRRRARLLLRGSLLLAMLAAIGLSLTACTGKLPAQNATWTAPGNYAITVTATQGGLARSATYNLTVTAK